MDNSVITTLLGRELFTADMAILCKQWANHTILVSGAGGSIGSELVRTLAAVPCTIVLYDRSENNLVRMLADTRDSRATIFPMLGDVQEERLLEYAFRTHRPDIVIHAAAYKHVPLLESNPLQAVGNNVFGTQAVLRTAVAYDAQRFVLVSTDKAVAPSSVMGATKRVAEMLTLYRRYEHDRCQRTVVRLGNVLGSSGSVLPLFERQIAAGGPVTITDPKATRFFMAIPEAANLILHAAMMGRGGETYVLDMGDPVNILELALRLIKLRGAMDTVGVVSVGMRPGEKLTEQLYTDGVDTTAHPRIWRARTSHTDPERLARGLYWLKKRLDASDVAGVMEGLRELVPEYTPQGQGQGVSQ